MWLAGWKHLQHIYPVLPISLLQVFGDSDEEDLPETQVVGGAQMEERVSCSYMSAVLWVPSTEGTVVSGHDLNTATSPKISVCRVYWHWVSICRVYCPWVSICRVYCPWVSIFRIYWHWVTIFAMLSAVLVTVQGHGLWLSKNCHNFLNGLLRSFTISKSWAYTIVCVRCAVQAWVGLVYCYGPWHFWSRQEFECCGFDLYLLVVSIVWSACVWSHDFGRIHKLYMCVHVSSSYPHSQARPTFRRSQYAKAGRAWYLSIMWPACLWPPWLWKNPTSCNCMYVWVAVHRSWPSQDSSGVLVQCVSHRRHLKEKSQKRHLQMMVCNCSSVSSFTNTIKVQVHSQ